MSSKKAITDIKLLMLGDSGVGKTWLLSQYADRSLPTETVTLGIDYRLKSLCIEDKKFKLQIWDTAGQERFRSIAVPYYRGAHGIILVYDVTDRESFEQIRNWMADINNHANENVNKILIGNKCDMSKERVISEKEGLTLASECDIDFFETSAKNNINVDQAFLTIATTIKNRLFPLTNSRKYSNEILELQQEMQSLILRISSKDSKENIVKKCKCC